MFNPRISLLTFGLAFYGMGAKRKPMSLEQLAAYNKPDREQVFIRRSQNRRQNYLVYLFGGRLVQRSRRCF